MADVINLQITGLKELADKLRTAGKGLEAEVGRELYQFGEEVMTASKLVVPVRTGTLMNTGQVQPPATEGVQVVVRLGYGGPAAPYALYVHEALEGAQSPNPSWSWAKDVAHGGEIHWTRPGSGPKYLENPLKERQGELPRRIRDAVMRALKGA
jgi:hypothetical protein